MQSNDTHQLHKQQSTCSAHPFRDQTPLGKLVFIHSLAADSDLSSNEFPSGPSQEIQRRCPYYRFLNREEHPMHTSRSFSTVVSPCVWQLASRTLCSRSSASFHINQTMAACASFMVINLAVVARRSVWMLAHSRCMTLFILVVGRVPIMGVPVSAGARKFKINQFPTTNNKASHRASGSSMHAMHAREETWGCCGMTRFFYGKLFLPISSTTR